MAAKSPEARIRRRMRSAGYCKCGATTDPDNLKTPEELVEVWNTRVVEKSSNFYLSGYADGQSEGHSKDLTCHNVCEQPKDGGFWPTPHFKCSECGKSYVLSDYAYYCPNCKAKVVDE